MDECDESRQIAQLETDVETLSSDELEFDFDFSRADSADASLGDDNELHLQPMRILEPRAFFTSGEQQSIFNYFASTLLPSLVHRDAHPAYHNHFYMLNMGLESPILMNAMVACAAINLSNSSDYYRSIALKNYVAALSSMREDIHGGRLMGTEDHLLATTALLCIFEVCGLYPPSCIETDQAQRTPEPTHYRRSDPT